MRRSSQAGERRSLGNCCAAIPPIAPRRRAPAWTVLSTRAGGCTFAADPAQDCASSSYMWTTDADRCVLRGRSIPMSGSMGAGSDLSRFPRCTWQGAVCHHVRLDLPDGAMRLDLVGDAIGPDAVMVEPAIDLGRPLDPQLASLRRLEALRAADALASGASLRDIGVALVGDDWPGDGEHVKSRARRRVVLAAALSRAGARGVFSG